MILTTVVLAALLAGWLRAELARREQDTLACAQRMADGDFRPSAPAPLGETALHDSLQRAAARIVRMVVDARSAGAALGSAAADLARAGAALAANSRQQAACLQQAAAAADRLGANESRSTRHARQAGSLGLALSEAAQAGCATLAQLGGSVAASALAARKVAKIAGVVDAIALKTNLLALNAVIEATRAGAQGAGFVIVAGEVGSLARSAAAAASEIKGLIAESLQHTTGGEVLANQAARSLGDIVDKSVQMGRIIGQLDEAGAARGAALDQTAKALAALEQGARHGAALISQTGKAAASMRDQAGALARVLASCTLPPEHAGAPLIHLAHSNPRRPARAPTDLERPTAPHVHIVPPSPPRGAHHLDWEEC